MVAVDMRKKIEDIQSQFNPRADINPQAINEAAILWGGLPNNRGTLPSTEENVVRFGKCVGTILLAETEKGYWLTGFKGESSHMNLYEWPNVWQKVAYTSRHEARQAALDKLCSFFEVVSANTWSTNSSKNRTDAQKAILTLNTNKIVQLSLF